MSCIVLIIFIFSRKCHYKLAAHYCMQYLDIVYNICKLVFNIGEYWFLQPMNAMVFATWTILQHVPMLGYCWHMQTPPPSLPLSLPAPTPLSFPLYPLPLLPTFPSLSFLSLLLPFCHSPGRVRIPASAPSSAASVRACPAPCRSLRRAPSRAAHQLASSLLNRPQVGR